MRSDGICGCGDGGVCDVGLSVSASGCGGSESVGLNALVSGSAAYAKARFVLAFLRFGLRRVSL